MIIPVYVGLNNLEGTASTPLHILVAIVLGVAIALVIDKIW